MSSLALVSANLPPLVVLPGRDADVIEDILAELLNEQSTSQSAAPQGRDEEQAEAHKQRWALEILRDAVATPSHLWHLLDCLGKRLPEKCEFKTGLRGLLLLHGFLRTCNAAQHADVVKLLVRARDQNGPSSDRTSLDLLLLSTSMDPILKGPKGPVHDVAATSARAYAKFLLRRLACSRFVSIPSSNQQQGLQGEQGQRVDGGNSQGGSSGVKVGESGISAQYWAQLAPAELMQQLGALQRLQEAVVKAGLEGAQYLRAVTPPSPPSASPAAPPPPPLPPTLPLA